MLNWLDNTPLRNPSAGDFSPAPNAISRSLDISKTEEYPPVNFCVTQGMISGNYTPEA